MLRRAFPFNPALRSPAFRPPAWPPRPIPPRPFSAPPLDSAPLHQRINGIYDNNMYAAFVEEYYDHSGFHNFGYWTPRTRSQREASENLVDVLTDCFPHKSGTILDVACGMGASTRRLLRHYQPRQVTAINISEKQLATCRKRAPGCRFVNMDATRLRFPDCSFDNVLCVEAAFHFHTREQFLREAFRVLKPGGRLALSDILLRDRDVASQIPQIPLENFVSSVDDYRSLLERAGFTSIRIAEALAECWGAFREHSFRFVRGKVLTGELPPSALRQAARGQRWRSIAYTNYLLVSAQKPGSPRGAA
jgi:MPBQ/MSBQ methyltransferase